MIFSPLQEGNETGQTDDTGHSGGLGLRGSTAARGAGASSTAVVRGAGSVVDGSSRLDLAVRGAESTRAGRDQIGGGAGDGGGPVVADRGLVADRVGEARGGGVRAGWLGDVGEVVGERGSRGHGRGAVLRADAREVLRRNTLSGRVAVALLAGQAASDLAEKLRRAHASALGRIVALLRHREVIGAAVGVRAEDTVDQGETLLGAECALVLDGQHGIAGSIVVRVASRVQRQADLREILALSGVR